MSGETVTVYDMDTGIPREVPAQEAALGMLRYAGRLQAGSAHRGAVEDQALGILRAGGAR